MTSQINDPLQTRDPASLDDLPMMAIAPSEPSGKAPKDDILEKDAIPAEKDHDRGPEGEREDGERPEPTEPQATLPVSKEVQELRVRNLMGWLMSRYEANQETSVPRSAVFAQYEIHCTEQLWDAVNPATFGKVIRAVFPDLKTRRLGMRGQSKYHYFGIKPRMAGSEGGAETTSGGGKVELEAQRLISFPIRKRSVFGKKNKQLDSASEGPMGHGGRKRGEKSTMTASFDVEGSEASAPTGTHLHSLSAHNKLSTLATETVVMTGAPPRNDPLYHPLIPDFDEFARFVNQIGQPMPEKLPTTIHPEAMCAFSVLYQNHIVQLLRLIAAREFQLVEMALSMFWSHLPRDLWPCLACEEGLRIVSIADDYLFQVAIHILVPDVLEPLPLIVTQSIRHFAKSLEHWMGHVFETSLPLPIVETKLDTCRRFCQVLRRRTSLNHLAQAVRAILTSPEHTTGMLKDFASLDFGALREQVQWVIPGHETFLAYMEESFRGLLFEGAELRAWVEWLESVVEQTLATQIGIDFQEAGRELMLRWSFFTTMILRDLTLRSASSFGKLSHHSRCVRLMS